MKFHGSACLPLLLVGALQAAQVCDLTLTACPKALPAGTLTVPMDVISLDARVPVCQESGVITSQVQPSIVFIIDNSGSMSMGDYDDDQETDPTEARFSVVASLLEEINAAHPGTEVGLVAFSRRLQFDHRDNAFFKTAFPTDTSQHDSYAPLTALNKVFPNGRTGLDTLRSLLQHDTDGNMTYATKLPASRGSNDNLVQQTGGRLSMRPGTDITLGFEAAKLAMADSKSPKANQFFVFLSDGAPGGVDSGRTAMQNDFERGTNTPTTFTVYFTRGNGSAPAAIRTMTTNIQNNGYSTSNPQSAAYSVGAPATELQNLLRTSVLNRILTVPTAGKSVELTVDGKIQTTANRGPDSSSFVFSSSTPLSAGLTQIQFKYSHSFRDTTVTPAVMRDTLVTYTLAVQRGATASLPASVTKTCREQAALNLFSGGQMLNSVTANQANLEVRVTPSTGQTCTNCSVQISPSGTADRETLPLTGQAGYASGSFVRVESLTPAAGDGKLQHVASDSLIFLWTNPANPLDVVRRSFPYQTIPASLSLFSGGKQLDTVTADHGALEIHLALPTGETCNACQVQVLPSGSPDRENVTLSGGASPYLGSFSREVSVGPVPGDGKLSHLATDSIVLVYVNPLTQQQIRRSYPYVDFKNEIDLKVHNAVARMPSSVSSPTGMHWAISDTRGLVVQNTGKGLCCDVLTGALNAANPDSSKYVGLKIEATREFKVEVSLFTNLGAFVNSVAFTVPRAEFTKLSPVAGKEARVLRLLWKGLSESGARAGTGAYIFRSTVSLLPVPGLTASEPAVTTYRTLGVVREL